MIITSTDLLLDIASGKLDAELQYIKAVIQERNDDLEAINWNRKRRSLKRGDTVYFTETVNPKYLAGVEAKVTKINPKKVLVVITNPNDAGRFGTKPISCPLSILTTEKP